MRKKAKPKKKDNTEEMEGEEVGVFLRRGG